MIDVETSIEPPGLVDAEDEPGEGVLVNVSLWEPDGTRRAAHAQLLAYATDEQLADALIACLRGCAVMRGPGLAAAIERRLR